jgi:hypothetical protein
VTEFTYQAYPHANPCYSGIIIYTPTHLEAIVKAYNEWAQSPDGNNPKTIFAIVVAMPPPAFTPTLCIVPFYDGDEVDGRRIFKPFFDINPAVDMTRSHPYTQQVPHKCVLM